MNYDLCCILWPFFLNDANVKWNYHLFLVHLHSRATISFRFDIWVKVTLALGLLFGGVLLFEDFCTSFCFCIHSLSVTLIALFFAYRQFSLLYVFFMSAIFPFSTFISPALFPLLLLFNVVYCRCHNRHIYQGTRKICLSETSETNGFFHSLYVNSGKYNRMLHRIYGCVVNMLAFEYVEHSSLKWMATYVTMLNENCISLIGAVAHCNAEIHWMHEWDYHAIPLASFFFTFPQHVPL